MKALINSRGKVLIDKDKKVLDGSNIGGETIRVEIGGVADTTVVFDNCPSTVIREEI